jgi:hypothetical protein
MGAPIEERLAGGSERERADQEQLKKAHVR